MCVLGGKKGVGGRGQQGQGQALCWHCSKEGPLRPDLALCPSLSGAADWCHCYITLM